MSGEERHFADIVMWSLRSELEVQAVSDLHKLPDRAAAIVGAAIIESQILEILKQELRNGKTFEQFFVNSSGAGSTLAAKLNVLYMLRLISKDAKQDLSCIGDIRNLFAHRLAISSFEHELVSKKCLELKMVEQFIIDPSQAVAATGPTLVMDEANREALKNPRSRFFLSISCFTHKVSDVLPRLGSDLEPYV